ncbi:MAG: isoprenylcysteine carboxylmethyltransferase family protein [Methanobrevibacter sp.]|uniref:methyltransferase family protein n=1 Tax=Methanobrevibacter sp. TaxID=66852 RepID=UPI001B5FA3EE|nr:isoprenylcysteine carboxylmethyltransferase family protein [Methanobrevibacter sp.]MBP3791632.1 isoprenylcysteine carboxylmethyltransferase family protein [Methanobrevibacter sp.]
MEKDTHLPLYGVGPFLVAPVIITAIIGLILTFYGFIPKYEIISLNWLLTILGILIVIYGIFFWISAVKSDIDDNIKENKLMTTGIYGLVRHPIYAAFLHISIGLILISNNVHLFFLPIIYWIFLSMMLKRTEEKWLVDLYGEDYINYSKEVNRFFPKLVK